jgi:hypothetical protein
VLQGAVAVALKATWEEQHHLGQVEEGQPVAVA